MPRRIDTNFLPALFAVAAAVSSCARADIGDLVEKIKVPEGFKITVYADNVDNARSMVLTPNGTLFVGTRGANYVYAVRDNDGDQRGEAVYTILAPGKLPDGSEVWMPNGVAFRDGALYVATVNQILRFDDIEAHLEKPPTPVIVTDDYPAKGHHGWKYIAFGPDGKLYVPVGAPCNICDEEDDIFASITRINPDGTGREIVAHGVRNTVGFAWHPETGELWFTDNGRDLLGDEEPGDELNRVEQAGQHFGFPYVHEGTILDPQFGTGKNTADYVAPAAALEPHVAALGMRFYTGTMFPESYRNQIFIAEHGSWNRREKSGYRVMLVRLEGNRVTSYEPFAEGWLSGQQNWGRPADVLVMPDGALLVSDDQAGVIYRISYGDR